VDSSPSGVGGLRLHDRPGPRRAQTKGTPSFYRFTTTSSRRRFIARPSSVSLDATGFSCPKPAVLMRDSPGGGTHRGLAPMLVEEIFGIIRQIHATGTTVLLVEQNANKALSIADYGFVLETGTIALAGDSQQLLRDDRVRRAYLGQR
jgi:ABC-type cobalamin transport system ATPase subunit